MHAIFKYIDIIGVFLKLEINHCIDIQFCKKKNLRYRVLFNFYLHSSRNLKIIDLRTCLLAVSKYIKICSQIELDAYEILNKSLLHV